MRILITGANGFVGRSLCSAFLREGHLVRGAIRQSVSDVFPYGVEYVQVGEINETTDWSAALAGIDVLVHLAARVHVMHDTAADPLTEFQRVNTAGTEHLAISAAANGVKRLVYVSSIKVNGEETQGEGKFSELDVPSPQDPYGISKWKAELVLHRVASETGLEVVIVRPPLVYGPGVKGNFASMLKVLSWRIPIPLASVANHRDLVYVENLSDALVVCATHPAAVEQTYLISDGEAISTPDLLRQLASAMGYKIYLLPFPLSWLRALAKIFGKSDQAGRLLGSLQVDSGKIRSQLDWRPPYTIAQGLHKTVDKYYL
jgi:nucleoside-diphosphate-sugar epimerase